MLIDHQQRLLREPGLRDLSNWPVIAPDTIDKPKRADFRRNWRAVKMALAGHRYGDIQQATGVHPSHVTRLLKRALSGPEDEPPPLTQALIPGTRVQPLVRLQPLSRIDEPRGAKCAFQYLLETVPELKEKLEVILKASLSNSGDGENVTPASFHESFKLFLEHAGHPTDCYPYTEDSLGYESARQYMHRRLDELQVERIAKKQPKRIIMPHERPFEIGREIQLDEQTYDDESSVYLELSGNLIPQRVARFAVVLVADADTSCILSFRLAFTQHCSQYDVLSAMEMATLYTAPAELQTPGIYVPPGPCFPNQLGEDYARIAFNTVALDNALAHCADSVEAYVCDHHQGTSSLGLPATPKPRHVIEQAFRLLSQHAKRHKSTSGSHPKDPLRESARQKKRPPVVTVFELEEAIYAVLAKHNTTPLPHLMSNTPLQLYEQMMHERPLRLLPETGLMRRSPFELTKVVPVKWLQHEERAPHINFYHCRYKGPCLSRLANKKVTVVFDYRDIRQLQVLDASGRLVGSVRAPTTWQTFPHGVKTRQYIVKLCRIEKRRMKDPLTEYFWLQIQRRNSKKGTLEMLRLYREYTGIIRPRLESDNTKDETKYEVKPPELERPTEASPRSSEIPRWTPEIANANRDKPSDHGK